MGLQNEADLLLALQDAGLDTVDDHLDAPMDEEAHLDHDPYGFFESYEVHSVLTKWTEHVSNCQKLVEHAN